jgi:hypothetical protein
MHVLRLSNAVKIFDDSIFLIQHKLKIFCLTIFIYIDVLIMIDLSVRYVWIWLVVLIEEKIKKKSAVHDSERYLYYTRYWSLDLCWKQLNDWSRNLNVPFESYRSYFVTRDGNCQNVC